MTRLFNFLILVSFAGIYYVQSDGFGSANATSSETTVSTAASEQLATAVIEPEAIVAPEVVKVAYGETQPEPVIEQPAIIKPTNIMSETELAQVGKRFLAKRLIASTLVREVELVSTARTAPEGEKVLQVSGSVVNARSAPTTNSDVLTRLRRGTEVVGTGETDGAWAEVMVLETGETVWMHSKFLTAKS